ncbi:MAG: transketolase [Candidatus Pelagibacter sp. TMED273]|mgnify:CR=1 FL=1|nr:MAG: transketolase [Candidatus Pelagibacter sp. TMED273]|tara:strand:- start:576 stop:1424 length:849 start_codon:yes stop_codon:yes gene_type:complete
MKNEIETLKKIKEFSNSLKKNILDVAFKGGAERSHIGGALSSTDIVSVLYSHVMKFNKMNPKDPDRDRFILSKGHACLVLYSALYEIGFLSKEQFFSFEKENSILLGHPVINKDVGIEFSNGSLGMGLSLGVGVSLSAKIRKKNYFSFVLVGDGECNEGSIWEAAMSASKYKLNNLVAIIDNNGLQQTGTTIDIMDLNSLDEKWASFGWNVISLDGHNIKELFNSLNKDKLLMSEKPTAIVAKTIKGKGVSFIENNNEWHHNLVTKSQYDAAIAELGFKDDR